MKITMTISLKGVVRQDDVAEGYVSFCPALKIYAHGTTSEEAMVCMEKTLTLYLETCLMRGTLDSVLKTAGFKPVTGVIHVRPKGVLYRVYAPGVGVTRQRKCLSRAKSIYRKKSVLTVCRFGRVRTPSVRNSQ